MVSVICCDNSPTPALVTAWICWSVSEGGLLYKLSILRMNNSEPTSIMYVPVLNPSVEKLHLVSVNSVTTRTNSSSPVLFHDIRML